MVVVTPLTQVGLEQLIAKAEAELATFQAESEHAEARLTSAQAELEAIASRQSARNQHLYIAVQTVATLKEELATVQALVRLSEYTLTVNEPEASAKDLTARLQKAEKDLERLRARLDKEIAADDLCQAAALRTLSQAQETIASITKAQQSMSAVRSSAFEELGQVIQISVQRRIEVLNEEIEVRRQGAVRAVQVLDAYKDEALHLLQRWPEIQDQIKPLLPYHDNSTDILEAQLHLVDLLLSEGLGANIESAEVFRRAGLPWGDMPGLLAIDPANFYPAFNGSNSPTVLLERKRDIEKLLEVYRAEKKGVASPVEQHAQAKRQRW